MNAFVGSLNFEGLYDIDMIQTTDGQIYFVEVNMRYGASGYAVTKCGVNLPGMFADYMLFGKPVDMNCKVTEYDKTFVSEKVLIEEYMKGRIPFSMVKKCMDEVDIHFIKNDEDPQAYDHFKKFYTPAKAMRQYNAKREREREKRRAEKLERRAKRRMEKLKALEEAGMLKVEELGDLDTLLYSDDFYYNLGIDKEVIKEIMREGDDDSITEDENLDLND